MSRTFFRNYADVVSSELFGNILNRPPADTGRVYKSKRLDNIIYDSMRKEYDIGLDEFETEYSKQLSTFPSLLRDTFQSVYSFRPQRNDPESLSATAKAFNLPVMDRLTKSDDYAVIKKLCEGRDIHSYEAVKMFCDNIVKHLGELMNDGKQSDDEATQEALRLLGVLAKLDAQLKTHISNAKAVDTSKLSGADMAQYIRLANEIVSKDGQIQYLTEIIQRRLNSSASVKLIDDIVRDMAEHIVETSAIISTWGNDEASPEAHMLNQQLVSRVNMSAKLKSIARQLGRLREIYESAKKNSFAFGRGDKYDIELGGDFTRAISSEYSMLAHPDTAILFARKVQNKTLKQYRRRERIAEGDSDFIVCIDTSGSMQGDREAWSKAVAMSLMNIAAEKKRNFALINFSSDVQTAVFIHGQYSYEDVFTALEVFQNGGTNFEKPLEEAIRLMDSQDFRNADIVFITDGECEVSTSFADRLREKKYEHRCRITGIVIDTDDPGQGFSLEPFCDTVHRLSELNGDGVASALFTENM